MLHNRYIARSGLTAIAAVLALSSTPLAAQEVDTAVESPPAEATPATEAPAPAADPLAPVEAETKAAPAETKTAAPAKSTRSTKASQPRAAAKPAAAARTAAPAAASAPVASAPIEAPVADPAASPAPPVPVEQLAANAMTPDVAAPESPDTFAVDMDQALPIAGAAGLALVGFAGLGLAMRRRRRAHSSEEQDMSYRDWHEWHEHEPSIARAEPVAEPTPAPVEPQTIRATTVAAPAATFAGASAFGWGNKSPMQADAPMTTPASNESRMDAAYRGPTPDNPFLSLKKRLRRAAFFDQRERAVSEGLAKPISPMAGLPKALNGKSADVMRGGTVKARPELVPA